MDLPARSEHMVSWQEALPHPPLEQLLPDALVATLGQQRASDSKGTKQQLPIVELY